MNLHAIDRAMPHPAAGLRALACGLLLLISPWAKAALTDLANVPIASAQSALVKPNLMLLMDASGSMRASHMPDDLEDSTADAQPIGYRASQCNSLYYNPNTTYVLPKVVDTTDVTLPLIDAPIPNFFAAKYDFYNVTNLSPAGNTDVDLGAAFQAFDHKTRLGLGESTTEAARSDTPQAAYYFQYSVAGTQNYKTSPCTDPLGTVASPAGGTWTKVTIGPAEQANFAIWYSYYRTRLALVKSGIGSAISGIDEKFRVGFITVAPLAAGDPQDANVPPLAGSAVVADKYEPIGDFDATQRKKVYDKLYAQIPGGASPAREGLARVGRHYSDYGAHVSGSGPLREDGINKGMPQDPVQYTCQRNYTIMTTDGYWNKTFETAGAVQMDGVTKVGQQDSPLTGTGLLEYAPRPIFDGGSSGYTVEQKQNYDYQVVDCSSGNDTQTVTSYTRALEQYFIRTQYQYRMTSTLTYEKTRTKMTTTTQTMDTSQLKEKVTHEEKTVTHSTRRDTVSTSKTEQRSKVETQIRRNDQQLGIKYEYVKMIVKTATQEVWTRTRDVEQWQEANNDGTWDYVAACSAGTVGTSGCRHSGAWATNVPVDPANCNNQTATSGNNWKKTTCSAVIDSGVLALDPHDGCMGDSYSYHTNPKRRQTCTLITRVSYVSPDLCPPSSTPIDSASQIVTCGTLQTPTLSVGPPSGANVSACTPVNITNANLVVPGNATEVTNSYKLSCPQTVVAAPGGSVITDVPTQQYAVNPASCPITVGPPPSAMTTISGSGLMTTCTPVIVTTAVAFDCGGNCSTVSAVAPNWKETTYPSTLTLGTHNVDRAICPATATSDAVTSPYAHTTCTLVSDSSYAVDTATCTAGPSFDGTTTTSCATAAISGPTVVASCTSGFNLPAAGDTTTCNTLTDSDQGVAACTYGVGTNVIGNFTYACAISNVVGLSVSPPGSCVSGTVGGVTTTCYPPVSVDTYVPKGNYTDVTTGPTLVSYVMTTDTPLQPVPPGACSVAWPSVYASYAGGYSYTKTQFNTGSAAGGYTDTCVQTNTTWTQEALGTLCPVTPTTPADMGWGPMWSGFSATNPVTQTQTTCGVFDSGPQVQNALCTPGNVVTGNLNVSTCSMNAVSPAAPGPACSTGFFWTGTTWNRQVCATSVGTPMLVSHASCMAAQTAAATASPVTSSVTCAPDLDSWQMQSRLTTRSYKQILSGSQAVGAPSLISTVGPSAWANQTACTSTALQAKPLGPFPSVDAQASAIAPAGITNTDVTNSYSASGALTSSVTSPSACTAWPCIGTSVGVDNGSKNSLADVAQYYYATDLRASMVDNLLTSSTASPEDDRAKHQHMSTYVVGLGVSGTLAFNKNYRNPANLLGDFPAIRAGTKDWPVWPTAVIESSLNPLDFSDPRSIDDFWHTAVNGRGEYFSASDPYSMVSSIQGALNGINAVQGAGAGATSSTATPTTADNTVFLPSFKKVVWTGDLQTQSIDLTTGNVVATADSWSAQSVLETLVGNSSDLRKIVLRKPGGTAISASDNLMHFTYGNLSSAQKAYFDATRVATWSQFVAMNAAQKAGARDGNLVDYLRGQRGFEDFVPGDPNKLYRRRERVLGDIAGSQPAYVKGPARNYADPGYAAFKSGAAATRKKMVYAGANDGMLHAFYAPSPSDANWVDRGKEAWAYIPAQVLPNLHKLADVEYGANHQFYVDGTVSVGDVYDGVNWRTLLVGGLNSGGTGYYALDITDPDAPISLWEYSASNNVNVGLSFGRPILSKLINGTWVAMFTSGYNNADGNGYVYVLNAVTGALLKTVATGEGSAASPSGLREINNWVNNAAVDNTTQRLYGGDLLGNVWRFDVNGSLGAVKLATLKTTDATPTAQPITTRIELAEMGGVPYVYVGTGRLLGVSDFADTQQQSIYSFKDLGTSYPAADVRPSLKPMTITTVGSTRTVACTGSPAQCAQTKGWVIDLPESGERLNVDLKPGRGTLVFVTNVPLGDICSPGHSWMNYVDQMSGNQVVGAGTAGVAVGSASGGGSGDYALTVGLGLIWLAPDALHPDGSLKAIATNANGTQESMLIPFSTPLPKGRRISWREVAQ